MFHIHKYVNIYDMKVLFVEVIDIMISGLNVY